MLTELGGGDGGGTAVAPAAVTVRDGAKTYEITHGAVVIAAITSCTNTSNPTVMLGAGLVAKKAAERGLKAKPWVKTSLAPGSMVVTEYLKSAGLTPYLEALGFHNVGYGCTTCIGNSGPLPAHISQAVAEGDLVACSVLSGNRNFEGRVHAEVRMNFLASPPLVVAYAIAGRMDLDITRETPWARTGDGNPVYLKDIWPTQSELQDVVMNHVKADMFQRSYGDVFRGDLRWQGIPTPEGGLFDWDDMSTYIRKAPYFDGMKAEPEPVEDIAGARCLALLGDSVTTDHISPAGSIKRDSPGGHFLVMNDVLPTDFNSYGSRRGNHEVMMRGTFSNVRLRNRAAPGTEGGFTTYFPTNEVMPIYDAAMQYQEAGIPLVVLGGKEYGTGSSRDWAAKGSSLLGIRAVIAESFERIHRSNLVGMGVLPLQFKPGESAEGLGLTGRETFRHRGGRAGRGQRGAGDRHARGRRRANRLSRGRAHRHAQRGGLLPARRHPAVRPAAAPEERGELGPDPFERFRRDPFRVSLCRDRPPCLSWRRTTTGKCSLRYRIIIPSVGTGRDLSLQPQIKNRHSRLFRKSSRI